MTTHDAPQEAKLGNLLDLFPAAGLAQHNLTFVREEDVPAPYHQLLVHHHHMTVTLEAHHGGRLLLEVRESRQSALEYARSLRLSVQPVDDPVEMPHVVLVGIMKINLAHCDHEVRQHIKNGAIPLGRILIENEVLRWIEPEAFVKVKLDGNAVSLFGKPPAIQETYGRMATIFCNHEAAVELLEVVAPEDVAT